MEADLNTMGIQTVGGSPCRWNGISKALWGINTIIMHEALFSTLGEPVVSNVLDGSLKNYNKRSHMHSYNITILC